MGLIYNPNLQKYMPIGSFGPDGMPQPDPNATDEQTQDQPPDGMQQTPDLTAAGNYGMPLSPFQQALKNRSADSSAQQNANNQQAMGRLDAIREKQWMQSPRHLPSDIEPYKDPTMNPTFQAPPITPMAKGGIPRPQRPYLVNEKGPEMFQDDDGSPPKIIGNGAPMVTHFTRPGTIIPNHKLPRPLRNTGPTTAPIPMASGGTPKPLLRRPQAPVIGIPNPYTARAVNHPSTSSGGGYGGGGGGGGGSFPAQPWTGTVNDRGMPVITGPSDRNADEYYARHDSGLHGLDWLEKNDAHNTMKNYRFNHPSDEDAERRSGLAQERNGIAPAGMQAPTSANGSFEPPAPPQVIPASVQRDGRASTPSEIATLTPVGSPGSFEEGNQMAEAEAIRNRGGFMSKYGMVGVPKETEDVDNTEGVDYTPAEEPDEKPAWPMNYSDPTINSDNVASAGPRATFMGLNGFDDSQGNSTIDEEVRAIQEARKAAHTSPAAKIGHDLSQVPEAVGKVLSNTASPVTNWFVDPTTLKPKAAPYNADEDLDNPTSPRYDDETNALLTRWKTQYPEPTPMFRGGRIKPINNPFLRR